MFTIENDQGTYAMTFDTAPEGLADVKEGDQVTVTYTGELSEVDCFYRNHYFSRKGRLIGILAQEDPA